MGRTRFVLLALVAAFVAALVWAGPAAAATVSIDAMDDSPGSRWVPPNVTINTGDTVRWEFDEAQTVHDVTSTSDNWTLDSGIVNPDGPPVEFTFDEPGTYTFVCEVHQATMTGSVTVGDEPAEPLQNVLVFSKTAGFRHDSIPQGIAAIEQLGAENDFNVDATEDAALFTDANLAQYDVVVFLSTTGDVLDDTQQGAFERFIQAGGGYAGIHAAADTEYTWPWYGEMLGGYFRNHPPGTPTAAVDIEDPDEPSTTGLPERWTRTDEWYNFQNPVNPVVNGGGDDYSPRGSDVKVLATVDESTYDEQDGNTTDDDHPVAWCSQFDGGRVWYTAMGHTSESFNTAEGNLRSHILGGLRTAAGVTADCGEPREASPSASDFEKVTLDDDTQNPMELDIAPDGRVFYIERDGRLMIWKPDTGQTVQAGSIPVTQSQENGLLGIQLAPNFATTGHVYMSYSALPDSTNQNRLSRFTVEGDAIVAGSEQMIYTWQHQRAQCCHTSGSLAFAPDGSLYISTGDNTNPFDSNGFTPIDERPGREAWDAQRSSANTNNPNGKILHIIPKPDAAGAPGIGTTYEIPSDNMFPVGTAQTLPEIYAMGFRNPFRITVDPTTGWLLLGDYGPDSPSTDPNRGPQGSVEYNVVNEAGFYGWPYCVRQNVAYNDYDFATSTPGPKFNCDAPVNNSPNNTGLTNLPAAKPATMWMGYSETDARFPLLGGGGAPTGGPRYEFDPDLESDTKFPEFYDGQWFIGEWNNGWIKTATLDDQGAATAVNCFVTCANNTFPGDGYLRPMDIEFGPDGSLYVIEWGSGFGGNNADSGVYRIDYIKGERKPIAHATATPDSGPVPLDVQFSSEGSIDPEGTSLTYEWDFDGDGDTDSTDPNPTHRYETAGNFSAKLTVTDQAGDQGIDNVAIVAGNTRPEVTLELPENGRVADFGDTVAYEVSVTDAEDGSTEAGTIDCDAITINISLGHDQHAHELSQQTGCEGTFETEGVSGHGPEANVFTVVEAVYTDEGAGAAGPVTGRDEAILQPKQKQAEFWETTGRTADGRGTGDPGVVNEATTDPGGGQSAAFIEDGDWISFNPYNLQDLDSVRFRVASAGAGGIIELRYDAADGPLVAATPNIPPTGGWQTWTNVDLDMPDTVPAGTHRLFVVFRHPTATGSLMNLNWFRFNGKGAAVTAPPNVSATADPTSGEAPLDVAFDATATDPENEALTYEWDFGVPGTGDDTSTEEDPTFTYERPGNYTATVTANDASGGHASATVDVRVTSGDQCPTGPVRSDEFDGNALDTDRWTVMRPDEANPFSVEGGQLNLPIANGSMYGAGTTAKNIIVQPTPDGEWTATAKITAEQLTENYHQAGLRVWSDDDNWASVHMIHAGGQRDFEFIFEDDGAPRNEGQDKLGGIPADAPTTYYVRIASDGTDLTASYSYDGDTFLPVGRPAPVSAFDAPQIGPAALSDAAPSVPMSTFDWIRFEPDGTGGGGPSGPSRDDQFDGTSLDKTRWNAIVRDTPAEYELAGGKLTITTSPGDIYTGDTSPPPNNFILQSADHAGDDWVIETKIDGATIDGGYGQGGLMAYVDGDNYVKLDAIADAGQTRINRLELRSEVAGAIANPQDNIDVAEGTTEIWLRLTKTGTDYTGEYSFDGATWSAFPATVANAMAAPSFGLFAFGPQADGQGDQVPFEYFTLDGEDTGECECVSTGDEFDGGSLDKTKWNSIVREDESLYTVEDGALKVTTVNGDIYTGGDPAPTRNFFLQTPDHAGADWVIETKVSGSISGGYEQGGLLVYQDDGNYIKYDLISDDGTTAVNRIELRSEENEVIQEPQPQLTPLPTGTTEAWLRLTKAGDQYTGEYSFDGETWTALPQAVQNDMVAPRFGLFTLGVNSGGGEVVFDYFAIDGERGCEEPPPTNTPPVVGDVTATPTSGFAPLEVDFTAAATDADEDELTYSWDFDGDGTADADTADASHTYTEAGVFDAEVTVSDGEAERSKTVQVTVLGADEPGARFRTLVFSKTTGFRHASIPDGIAAIEELGAANDFQVDATEDSTVFRDAVLARYDTVVFLSTTGDPLNDEQQAAFERYIRAGGGYTGIHAAADTEYEWNWYGKLVGGYFLSHPPGTPDATVDIEDTAHHSTQGLPNPWPRTDEWYNYKSPDFADPNVPDGDYSPRAGGVHVLATVDEETYDEQDGTPEADDHPISWCQRYDGGRSWYTGMGHTSESFNTEEGNLRSHILGGLEITAGVVPDAECGNQNDIQVQAFADPPSGPAPLTVNFTAAALDPDGDELAYRWEFPDGTAFGSSVTRTLRTPGEFTATVTVTDPDGNSASDEVTVTVGDPQSEPPEIIEAAADRTSGPAPLDVLFHAVAEDPEGGDLTYLWDFGDGGSAFGDEVEHTYLEAGSYTATVTVIDETGESASAEIEITVADPPGNRPPTVEGAAAPASGRAPLEVLLTAQGSDPDGDVLTYRWDFGDGSAPVSGRTARHVYARNGVYEATVTATDRSGATGTDTVEITVGNPGGGQPPTVQVAADRTTGGAPLRVNFSAAGSDPDGDAIMYTWAFGDGGTAGGPRPTHTYTTPGTYTATVTVTDAGGQTGTASVTITVTGALQIGGAQQIAGAQQEQSSAARGALRMLSRPSLGSFRTRGLKVAATCAADGDAAVGLWASKKAARKLGLRSRGLGRKRFSCAAGRTVQLRLKPARKVRRALKAKRPASLRVRVALAMRDGAPLKRTLKLER